MPTFTTRFFAATAPVTGTVTKRIVNAIASAWRAHRNRLEVRQLLEFDDRALRDIGLTRGDVGAALSSGPFEDPSRRLVVLAVERRAGRMMQARERLRAVRAAAIKPLRGLAFPVGRAG
jgi:uncharacterized protein YjiS (DUF1127 family)